MATLKIGLTATGRAQMPLSPTSANHQSPTLHCPRAMLLTDSPVLVAVKNHTGPAGSSLAPGQALTLNLTDALHATTPPDRMSLGHSGCVQGQKKKKDCFFHDVQVPFHWLRDSLWVS